MNSATAAAASRRMIRQKVLWQMAGGLTAVSIPVAAWWYWAATERQKTAELARTAVRIPNVQDTDDFLITNKCQPGDVVVFDRRCEKCAAGPWAALSCLAGRQFLCNDDRMSTRLVDSGKFDHIGLIVPGYIKTKHDAFDPSNLLLLEATPSGIVARPLKTRLERTASRSVILLQLCSPGEKRNVEDDYEQHPTVVKTRQYVEKELRKFRDQWIELGQNQGYRRFHSTVALGGALSYGLGLQNYVSGPVSPSAYLVLLGLEQAAAAQKMNEKEDRVIKVEDFLRDCRMQEKDVVRFRPGWRFLAPVPLRETSRS